MEHNAIVAEIVPDKEYVDKNGITDVKEYLQKYIIDDQEKQRSVIRHSFVFIEVTRRASPFRIVRIFSSDQEKQRSVIRGTYHKAGFTCRDINLVGRCLGAAVTSNMNLINRREQAPAL